MGSLLRLDFSHKIETHSKKLDYLDNAIEKFREEVIFSYNLYLKE
jgi:hypothetical protein